MYVKILCSFFIHFSKHLPLELFMYIFSFTCTKTLSVLDFSAKRCGAGFALKRALECALDMRWNQNTRDAIFRVRNSVIKFNARRRDFETCPPLSVINLLNIFRAQPTITFKLISCTSHFQGNSLLTLIL